MIFGPSSLATWPIQSRWGMPDMAFGRLERTPPPQPMADINVTPLVDVMLVLVVIFIITAPLLASAIRLDLPSVAGAGVHAPPAVMQVVIDRSGQMYLDDQPQTFPAMARALGERARENAETELQLRADENVPYGRVAEVLGLAQQAGLNRVSFVARRP
jgi:biopolymer transport protein TolR